jgi:hypothetical protein
MSEHPIQNLMETAMENIREMIDVNTIIGDPVETQDGQVIIPVSKVGFGFAAGGSEFRGHSDDKEGKIRKSGGIPDIPLKKAKKSFRLVEEAAEASLSLRLHFLLSVKKEFVC